MNRSDKKRAEREAKKLNNVYFYNEKQVNEIIAAKKEELNLEIIQKLFGVLMVSLQDEFGWFSSEKFGKKRIDRFITRFNENMSHIEAGDIKLADYDEWCEENNIKYEVKKMSEGAYNG